MAKLWGGRFEGSTDELVERLNNSLRFDARLWPYDIQGSIAHATMLGEAVISGRYVTHLLADANRAVPPFRSQMILRLESGTWRAVSIAKALTNDRWPLRVPEVAKDEERG